MDATTFISVGLQDLHAGFRSEVESLSQEEFLVIPVTGANPVAFLLWHFTRTEDEVLHRQVAGKEPLWRTDGWADHWHLDPNTIGTGFTTEQVEAFQPAHSELLAYCEAVWASVPAIMGEVRPEDLDRSPNPERPRMTLGRTIANLVLGHGFWHLGDVRYTKGLMGKPFAR